MAKFMLSAFADEASKTLEGQIAALQRNNFPYLEPRDIDGGILTKTDEELTEVRKMLDDAGISVYSLGSPIGKYKAALPFQPHWEKFLRALDICHQLGAKYMRVFSFFTPQESLAEYRDVVLTRLQLMVQRAKADGITLCHENESKIYGQNPTEIKDILDNVPGLMGVFDAANLIMNDQDPMAGFEATAEKLQYVHMKDAIAKYKTTIAVGCGEGRYDEVLQKVDAMTDRTVTLTLEPHLFGFKAFKEIDSHELKTAVTYGSADEAFDAAATALKTVLTNIGFHEEGNVWTK